MSNTKDSEEFSLVTKILAFAIVIVLAVLIFAGLVYISRNDEPVYSCETFTNPTPCPSEPDYDSELHEQLKQYPDDSY